MQVKDLQARMGKVDITLEVIEKSEPRTFDKFGKSGKVCNTNAKDETGTISVTLWNEDVDNVNVGDTIKIENGWVGEYQGELQLSTGKYGKLEVVGGGQQTLAEEPTEHTEEQATLPEEEPMQETPTAPEPVDEEPVTDEELVQ